MIQLLISRGEGVGSRESGKLSRLQGEERGRNRGSHRGNTSEMEMEAQGEQLSFILSIQKEEGQDDPIF